MSDTLNITGCNNYLISGWTLIGCIVEFSLKTWIGIILIVANQPLGVGALLICNAIAIQRHNVFYSFLGIGAYALSWGVLGLGLLLAGPEGIRYTYSLLRRLWRVFVNVFT